MFVSLAFCQAAISNDVIPRPSASGDLGIKTPQSDMPSDLRVWTVRRFTLAVTRQAVVAAALLASSASYAQPAQLSRQRSGYLTLESSPRYRNELQHLALASVTLIPRLERDLVRWPGCALRCESALHTGGAICPGGIHLPGLPPGRGPGSRRGVRPGIGTPGPIRLSRPHGRNAPEFHGWAESVHPPSDPYLLQPRLGRYRVVGLLPITSQAIADRAGRSHRDRPVSALGRWDPVRDVAVGHLGGLPSTRHFVHAEHGWDSGDRDHGVSQCGLCLVCLLPNLRIRAVD